MKLPNLWTLCGYGAALCLAILSAKGAAESVEKAENVNNPLTEVDKTRIKLDGSVFTTESSKAENYQFSTEVNRLLNIIIRNVYTKRDALVRELISNSLDAIEKQHEKKLAVADKEGFDDIKSYKVVVEVDSEAKLLSFSDNGVGMTHDELKSFLGTIAKSGTAEFAADKKLKDTTDANLIGQFGVGFYSAFLAAEKVAVISKSDSDPKQWIWETDASASFRIREDPNGPTLGRGTRVLLKIKDDAKEFLDHNNLEKIMKEYFAYDRHRIYLVKPKEIEVEAEDEKKDTQEQKEAQEQKVEVEDDKTQDEPKKKIKKTIMEQVLISQDNKPVWQRNPSEVKPEEYEQLYKTITNDKWGKPIAYSHFAVETGSGESFRAVLFIPERPPFSPFTTKEDEQLLDLKLHVRGVFVTAKFDNFIPKHLSFVRGIIDSDDISLNISREFLQDTGELRGIRKKIIKKLIDMMIDLAANQPEKFKKFYDAYSSHIKLELGEHEEYRSLLSKLLRYETTKTEGNKLRSLDEYVQDMSPAQKEQKVIYYLAGFKDEIKNSPYLARFKVKGYEVILMNEPVDEHVAQRLDKYEEYKLVNIAKEGIKLDDEDEKQIKDYEEKYKKAKAWILKSLSDIVERVSVVPGPASVPGSLKSAQYGWTGNMERLISAQTSVKDDPMLAFFSKQKRILELNPQNEVVAKFLEQANEDNPDKELKATLRTFIDAMAIWSGFSIRDPSSFALGVERMTRKSLGLKVEELPEEKITKEEGKRDEEIDDDLFKNLSVHDVDRMAKADEEAKSLEQEQVESKKESEEKDEL